MDSTFLDASAFEDARRRYAIGDPDLAAAVARWRRSADEMLAAPLVSVTEKTRPAPSGNPHDYVSLSIYWWPNPLTGKPYYHRDGHRNPEADEYDAPRLSAMARRVHRLALVGGLTGERHYTDRAAEQLRVWFIDPATRMNPNLRHSQLIPGINRGSRQGVIEGVPLVRRVLDAAWLVDQAGAWTPEDRSTFDGWVRSYMHWLLLSARGAAERKRVNNHGTYYDLQVAALAHYLGDVDTVAETLTRARGRLTRQIKADGKQPEELRRTKSFDYSVYNLYAWFDLARLADRHGVNLWDSSGRDPHTAAESGLGRLRRALDYLVDHTSEPKDWPHAQLNSVRPEQLRNLLWFAAAAYDEPGYRSRAENYPHPYPRVHRELMALRGVAMPIQAGTTSRE
ncbi:MAG: alginate lyase family protein [Planctomycetota bacterium]